MSSTIRTILSLFVAQLLVTFCLAVEYQVPGVFKNITVGQPSKACSDSTYDVIGGAEILAEDCEVALRGWGNSSFNVEMYEWVDITDGMRDTKLINHGTCQLAMKRLGGYSSSLDDLLVIGDQDLKVLMNTSIEMARFGDGTKLHVVDGSMDCTTAADPDNPRGGTIDWTLRRTGIIEGYPPKGPFA